MFGKYYYHASTKKLVAAFGSLFNNIATAQVGSKNVTAVARCPISYGPRQKWLTRIKEEPDLVNRISEIAIRVPRMSFEITSMVVDDSAKIGKTQTYTLPNKTGGTNVVRQMVPYRIGLQLNILAKNQNDALQILEQIIPYFSPDYTLSIFDLDGTNQSTDVPIVLQSVSLQDDYEGDAMTRRTIVYTLDFEARLRFYGPMIEGSRGIIRTTNVHFYDRSKNNYTETITTGVPNPEDTAESNTIIARTTDFIAESTSYQINIDTPTGTFVSGEPCYTTLTATSGILTGAGSNWTITAADGCVTDDDYVVGRQSGAYAKIHSVQ